MTDQLHDKLAAALKDALLHWDGFPIATSEAVTAAIDAYEAAKADTCDCTAVSGELHHRDCPAASTGVKP